jgi:O-antigen ligase
MIEHRGFRIGFATAVLFTVLAGDAWRYSISWYGWGAVVLVLTAVAIAVLVRQRLRVASLPPALLAFLALATASIAWSFYPGASALGVTGQLVTSAVGVAVAIALSWEELLRALGLALRIILGASILFELTVSLLVRHPILPFWVDYGTDKNLPKLVYWSRDVLFVDGKIQGIVGNSSLLAMMALLGLIVFGVQLATGAVGRLHGLFWIVLAALIAIITRSATIFVGIVVCAMMLAAILLIRHSGTPRARVGTYSGHAVTALFAGTLVALFSKQLLALLGKSDTLTGRVGIWDAVIALAQQRPFFGWGWVSYWAPWVAPFDHLVKRAGVQQLHAHNAWLDVWLQLGFLGLIVFGGLVLLTLVRCWSLAVRRIPRPGALQLLPILLLTALLVQSLAESRLLVEYGWLLLTVLAVKTKRDEPAAPLRRSRREAVSLAPRRP